MQQYISGALANLSLYRQRTGNEDGWVDDEHFTASPTGGGHAHAHAKKGGLSTWFTTSKKKDKHAAADHHHAHPTGGASPRGGDAPPVGCA